MMNGCCTIWLCMVEKTQPSIHKHLIEDVQMQPNGEMRGMVTDKNYTAMEAIKMNEKYDRNFTNPNLRDEKSDYLTANEKSFSKHTIPKKLSNIPTEVRTKRTYSICVT